MEGKKSMKRSVFLSTYNSDFLLVAGHAITKGSVLEFWLHVPGIEFGGMPLTRLDSAQPACVLYPSVLIPRQS